MIEEQTRPHVAVVVSVPLVARYFSNRQTTNLAMSQKSNRHWEKFKTPTFYPFPRPLLHPFPDIQC